ncbi:Na(+)-translocating NADH-quinone reductase subunit A [Ostreibacterium oceani]|uniref:Na(+)-translocating NADH-quinone reductase subunit A n=1 Tax=Ostreibacterium oceani TaxID=2654998 RepID=A0A6N7EU68_9GAMM|nr:Na(+)-translocating NADH-quinone reductase subunit A [Ostreibacterium oceani]MPV85972.1 Na(+)-translocating NADH-quinone reductase subunit A [Ostreibacterium oceani]
MFNIKKGLDLPIAGAATGAVEQVFTQQVGVLGPEYIGMRPSMLVQEGDTVKRGQKLFEDKKNPGVFFTAPIAGTVSAINRGERRRLLSVVIDRQGDDAVQFLQVDNVAAIEGLSRDAIVENLLESGLWAALRTRPYSKSPNPSSEPNSLFVTAIDTNPLAVSPELVIGDNAAAFEAGLVAVSKLTSGKTYLCKAATSTIGAGSAKVEVAEFSGVHPAGLVGTHIHMLDPVNTKKTVWHLHYQDVIAIGRLFLTGQLDLTRIISVAGPAASRPKIVETTMGANIKELTADQSLGESVRMINGSVFSGGYVFDGTEFLGRFALQLSLLAEGTKKEFLGWITPGSNKFTVTRSFIGGIVKKAFNFTTTTNGSPRSMVPIGVYEKVMPLDILPTLLLKAIIVKDTETAQRLGVLELDEEDLALCTFVCPSKYEYGAILRENLEKIEVEG